jgi:hypothetical protein
MGDAVAVAVVEAAMVGGTGWGDGCCFVGVLMLMKVVMVVL